jgi:hypothetical protein
VKSVKEKNTPKNPKSEIKNRLKLSLRASEAIPEHVFIQLPAGDCFRGYEDLRKGIVGWAESELLTLRIVMLERSEASQGGDVNHG